MLGPKRSASSSPIRPPTCWSASARLTLTVDLPTPPFPLPTAMRCRIPGSLSELSDGRADAPGAWSWPRLELVVCIAQAPPSQHQASVMPDRAYDRAQGLRGDPTRVG